MATVFGDVRFASTTGLMHRSKQHRYSITSSARSKNDSGIFNPRTLAVVRLRTRSNFAPQQPAGRTLMAKLAMRNAPGKPSNA